MAAAFRRWVSGVAPALGNGEVVAIDGKTRRRSGKIDATPLHLVGAFAARANLVLEQRAIAGKSNEKTAISELLTAVKDNQPKLAESVRDFFTAFEEPFRQSTEPVFRPDICDTFASV